MDSRNWGSIAQRWVFAPLLRLTAAGTIEPVLAARVEALGPQRLRLWIRTDARFDDGSPVTFADVATSVGRNRLKAMAGDGEVIIIDSMEPGTPPELLLARTPIFHRAADRAFGAGPFRVIDHDARHITLQRRSPEPRTIGRVIIQSYPTPRDAFADTLKGGADLLPEVEPRWLEFFEGVPRLKTVRAPGTHANVVAFNVARFSRAQRIALRRALAAEDLRVQAFGDDCIPPEHQVEPQPIGPGPQLDVTAVPFLDRFAFAVRRTLGERGANIRILDLAAYFAALQHRDFDLALARPQIWPPGMAALVWRTGASLNVLGYSNPLVDAAVDERNWAAAQQALDDDPPAAFVCTPPAIMVVDSRIENPTASTDDLPRWRVAG